MKTPRALLVLAALTASTLVGPAAQPSAGEVAPAPTATTTPGRPNILTIMLDDANLDYNEVNLLDVMPKTKAFFADGGRRYTSMYANTPSCCPSRAEFFSGRFMHNNGVNSQGKADVLDPRTSIATNLRDAGYHTFIQGKYLNLSNTAAGFSEAALIKKTGSYRSFSVIENGVERRVEGEYITTYQGRKFRQLLGATEVRDAQPWFGEVAFIAPHTHGPLGAMAEERYRNAPIPGKCAYDPEADRSDKPPHVREFSTPIGTSRFICTNSLNALRSVDDEISATLAQLRTDGELDNTVVMLTSDNGIHVGAHQMSKKWTAYDPSSRVPLLLKGPGVPAGVDDRLVGMIDLRPTMLALSGASAGSGPAPDGRSVLGAYQRSQMLLEYDLDKFTTKIPAEMPTWRALTFANGAKYILTLNREGAITFREYYAPGDELELDNVLADGNPLNDPDVARLDQQTRAQARCAGTTPSGTRPACA